MGLGKREQELRDDENEAAIEIAIAADVLTRCEFCLDHDPIDAGGNDVDAAYKLGNALISRHDSRVAVFAEDRRAMTDAVQRVVEEYQYQDCTHRSDLARALAED